MAQLHINATVTKNSPIVYLPGDQRAELKPGDYFKVVGIAGVYEIGAISLLGTDTQIQLTAPCLVESGNYPALIHRDFSPEQGYPLIYAGDLDIPDLLRRWALQADSAPAAAVAAHVSAADPHPQYTTAAEAAAAAPVQSVVGRTGAVTAQQVADALNLGTAATRNVTTSSTDTTDGRVLTVGSLGLGNPITLTSSDDLNNIRSPGTYRHTGGDAPANTPIPGAGIINVFRGSPTGFVVQEWLDRGGQRNFQRAFNSNSGMWSSWVEFYHTGNTTVDGNGHLLVASPIIRLYDDRIEVEGNFHQPPQFERLDVGVYRITGTLGLRLDDGWYLETPRNRNGDAYFNVEWEQDVEPPNDAGIVDAPVDVVLTIRTFERVWNPQSGRHENGDPVDINERQTRHIALRFNELRREDPEPPTHDPS